MIALSYAMFAGIAVALQGILNSLMIPYLGAIGATFVGFIVQSALLISYQLTKEHRLAPIHKVPIVYYISGLIAVLNVSATGLCVANMGSSVTTCCSVSGQVIMSAIADTLGLFGIQKRPFTAKRLVGLLFAILGIITMNLLGSKESDKAPALFLIIATCLGACCILIRTINYKATQLTSSLFGGGLVNSLSGLFFGAILFFSISKQTMFSDALTKVPLLYYLAGVFGTACLLCNIKAYEKGELLYSTIFMLLGQVITGVIVDLFVLHSLSIGKLIGVLIVVLGVCIEKIFPGKLSRLP